MKADGIMGYVWVFIFVLLSIYVYNSFIAKDGESIANLGKK